MSILENTIFIGYSGKQRKKKVQVVCELCNNVRIVLLQSAQDAIKTTNMTLCCKCRMSSEFNPRKSTKNRQIMSERWKGVPKTNAHKIAVGIANVGKKRSFEQVKEMSKRMSGKNHPFYGTKRALETREKISKALVGFHNPNWKSAEQRKSKLIKQVRYSNLYFDWREKCFVRDGYRCVECQSSTNIQIDHIRPLALLLIENNLNTKEEAFGCDILWDVDNGRTLCKECHKKTETYGNKTTKIINDFLEKD